MTTCPFDTSEWPMFIASNESRMAVHEISGTRAEEELRNGMNIRRQCSV